MKKKTSRNETARKATEVSTGRKKRSWFTKFLYVIIIIEFLIIIYNVKDDILVNLEHLRETKQKIAQMEKQQQAEQLMEQRDVIYVIKRKIGNDEKREIQRMLREMSYTEVIPSTGYKKFDRFMCNLYTYESETGTVEVFVNPRREALIQVYKDDVLQIVDIIDNIDYTIGITLPKESIIFHDVTWIADENGMNKWEFGKRTLTVEESFKEYENTTLSILREHIIISSGERILEFDEDTYIELITDCKNGKYKFFNHSLFYINLNYDLVEYNLLTEEITKIDSEVYSIKGEIRVRYKVINDLEDRFIPGYIDKEGNRRRFTDYEIDENLIMTVNQQE